MGADIDPQALAAAIDAAVLHPCLADLWSPFPFADEAFDLIVAGEIVEHVPFPTDLVAEVARVLRLCQFVIGVDRVPTEEPCRAGFKHDPKHLRQFSPSMLRVLLAPIPEAWTSGRALRGGQTCGRA